MSFPGEDERAKAKRSAEADRQRLIDKGKAAVYEYSKRPYREKSQFGTKRAESGTKGSDSDTKPPDMRQKTPIVERFAEIHELKCWPKSFEAILSGHKTHEYRRDDRGFQMSDVLRLFEWDPETRKYTGRTVEVIVTWISHARYHGVPPGYVVMSIGGGCRR